LLKAAKYYSKIKTSGKIVEEINQTNESIDAKRRHTTYSNNDWRFKAK